MKYVFVDTDNNAGGVPSSNDPDTANSKYHTSGAWPAATARWASVNAAIANSVIYGLTDDITIYCRGTAADTLQVNFTATHATPPSWTIIGDLADAKWNTSKYRIIVSSTVAYCVQIGATSAAAFTLKNLQLQYAGTGSSASAIFTSKTTTVENCFIKATGSLSNCIRLAGTSQTFNIKNTITDAGGAGGYCLRTDGTGNTTNGYNSVFYNCVGSNSAVRTATTIKNCAFVGNTDDVYATSITTLQYSAGNDTPFDTGTGNIADPTWANQWEDYTNGDFRLKETASFRGAGIGPSSDANVPTLSINGETRSGSTTDIGPHFWVLPPTTLTAVDGDNIVYPGQTGVAITGQSLQRGTSALIRVAGKQFVVSNYSAGSAPTFDVPSLSTFFADGIPFGAADFDLLG